MTKRALLFLLVAFTLPVHADFSTLARAIDNHRGVHRVWIPFLGLARAVVWVARPEGVHDFQLATFEGTERLDPRELQRILAEEAGPGFKPLVRTWSRHSKEWTFIYVRPTPNSSRMELMVLTNDDEETVLVRVEVDAGVIARKLNDPRHVKMVASR